MGKRKSTNNDLQNITYKAKDWVTRTPLKTGSKSGAPEGWAVLAPLVSPILLQLVFYSFIIGIFGQKLKYA